LVNGGEGGPAQELFVDPGVYADCTGGQDGGDGFIIWINGE